MRKVLVAGLLAAASTMSMAAPPSVSCSAGVTNCAAAFDGTEPFEGESWQSRAAWWTGLAGEVVVSFGATYQLQQIGIVVDNNDDYRIERSLNGITWTTLGTIDRNEGTVNQFNPGGMDYFDSFADPQNPDFGAGLAFAPANAAFLRVTATGGDGSYSVGEITVYTTPAAVPEPATWALMLGGVGLLVSRRRARQR